MVKTNVIRYREFPHDGEAWEIFASDNIHKARRQLARLIRKRRQDGWFADVLKMRNHGGQLVQHWSLWKPGHPRLAESYFIQSVERHAQQ